MLMWIFGCFVKEPDFLMILEQIDGIWSKMVVSLCKQGIYNSQLHRGERESLETTNTSPSLATTLGRIC